MNTFFTSDTHFCHKNILKYSNRPFASIEVHDSALIDKWNSKVSEEDTVYHLGDFAFTNPYGIASLIGRLNFKELNFIQGNHDRELWDGVKIYNDSLVHKSGGDARRVKIHDTHYEKKIFGKLIVMNHYALRVWNKSHHGAFHLYGHSHGSLPDDPNALSFDIGVDCHNYFPLSFAEVEAIMATKSFKPIDHHGSE